ncbi:MAG: DUF4423 domain-containing protein [Myxococcales bacterium]|nr:DUF4423 domain-containing protein [Myxococcales bacterium]
MRDYDTLARELVRALRGPRSQGQLSRRLGCRSNVVYTWEAGLRWPTAAVTMDLAARTRIDVAAAWARFFRSPPSWLLDVDVSRPATLARLLDDLRGAVPIVEVARRAGRSRFAVARWLSGDAEPRLPDFLRLIEATSLRLLDWLACFVDMDALPSVRDDWRRLEAERRAAYEAPWTQAVLRALELAAYARLDEHDDAWVAAQLGTDVPTVAAAIQTLSTAGQLVRRGRCWALVHSGTTDTRRDAASGRRLKAHWAAVGVERLEAGAVGLFSYNVFSVSTSDHARLRDLHSAYFRELRAIVAQSSPGEEVVVANVQLFGLADHPPTR